MFLPTTTAMEKLCRVCLGSDGEMLAIFDNDSSGLNFATILSECTKYKVDKWDGLPRQICRDCMHATRNAYDFKLQCEKSYRILTGRSEYEKIDEEKSTQTVDSTIFPCQHCEEKYFYYDELIAHEENQHRTNPIMCRFCSKSFPRISFLRAHIFKHLPELGYSLRNQCTATEDDDDDDDEPLSALITKENVRKFSEVLLKESLSEVDLDSMTQDSKQNDGAYLEEVPTTSVEPEQEQKLSGNRTPIRKLAKDISHLRKSNDNLNIKRKKKLYEYGENKKSYKCDICEKGFCSQIYLRKHLEIHERKRFVCKECTSSFRDREGLQAHIKAERHDKPLLCPECGLRCKTSNILMIHMRRHRGEKPFKCKFCGKGFPRSDDVRVHEKYHTGERSHFCSTCGKGFQRKYNLTIHMRVHTGERPYKCEHCPQAFAQSNDLKAHIRRHTGERFRCEFCEASFLHGYQIRQHKLTEHGVKEDPPIKRLTKFTSPEEQEQQIKQILEKELADTVESKINEASGLS